MGHSSVKRTDVVFCPDVSLKTAADAVRVLGNSVRRGNWDCILSGLAGANLSPAGEVMSVSVSCSPELGPISVAAVSSPAADLCFSLPARRIGSGSSYG